jgi:ATP-binding protein involved in chromosome partitioning
VFGQAGGARIATEYQVELLGALPLDIQIRQQADAGVPLDNINPGSIAVECYKEIAFALQDKLLELCKSASPSISISDD